MSELTEGPISRAVLKLAWPVVLSEALHTLFHIVDLMWVGRLGAWATAAVSSSLFSLWILLSLANLVSIGATAQVARAIGSGDRERAARAAAQSWWLALALGVVVGLAGWFGAGPLFAWMHTSPEAAEAGRQYLRICALSSPIVFLEIASAACLRAAGDTRTPMWITAAALSLNAGLAPCLIYGWAGFPRLGVAGAALATLICHVGAASVLVTLALRGYSSYPFDRRSLRRLDWPVLVEQFRIGAPFSLVGILFSVNYLLFARLAAPFGDAAIALIGIGNRLESITYLGADGFGAAAATMVGQNLGAGRPARAARSAWIAAGIMSAGGAVMMLAMLLFPGPLLSLFTADPGVLALGGSYLRILALCQVATGCEGVLSLAFAGAGDTLPPMIIHIIFGVLRPLAAAMLIGAWGLGLSGIVITITLSCVARAAIITLLFLRGGWATRTVFR
jgi:putative MATE family efflux protein